MSYDPDITGPRSLLLHLEACLVGPAVVRHARLSAGPGSGAGGGGATEAGRERRRREVGRLWRGFVWSVAFSLPLFLIAMVLDKVSPFKEWLMTLLVNS